VVLAIGWWFTRAGGAAGAARVPVPVFAFVFLALCIVNSILPSTGMAPLYSGAKYWLVEASTDGLLIAISALGLGTSLSSVTSLGWRHLVTVVGTTVVILAIVVGALVALR
jgi:uncharacterized membrane protein YadS